MPKTRINTGLLRGIPIPCPSIFPKNIRTITRFWENIMSLLGILFRFWGYIWWKLKKNASALLNHMKGHSQHTHMKRHRTINGLFSKKSRGGTMQNEKKELQRPVRKAVGQ